MKAEDFKKLDLGTEQILCFRINTNFAVLSNPRKTPECFGVLLEYSNDVTIKIFDLESGKANDYMIGYTTHLFLNGEFVKLQAGF